MTDKKRIRQAEERIREVYLELSEKRQDWIRLARIRAELTDIPRDVQDAVLIAMEMTGYAFLSADSNTKMLTAEDHAAAIKLGGPLHLLAIDPEYALGSALAHVRDR